MNVRHLASPQPLVRACAVALLATTSMHGCAPEAEEVVTAYEGVLSSTIDQGSAVGHAFVRAGTLRVVRVAGLPSRVSFHEGCAVEVTATGDALAPRPQPRCQTEVPTVTPRPAARDVVVSQERVTCQPIDLTLDVLSPSRALAHLHCREGASLGGASSHRDIHLWFRPSPL